MGDREIKTPKDVAYLKEKIVGLKVTAIEREPDTDEKWPQGANGVTIRFDDGSALEFDGWGYDSSGLSTYLIEPK